MDENSTTVPSVLVPAYLSFTTFQWAINNLRNHGIPTKIDRSAFGTRSGLEQGQIMGAFKFLSLIDDGGLPQENLKNLVDAGENSEEERMALTRVLKNRYTEVFALNLESATPNQLEAAIGQYGATGSTRDRALRFFIKAVEHCSIPLSTRLTKGIRTRRKPHGNSFRAEKSTPRKGKKTKTPPLTPPSQPSGDAMKTITLPGASGSLTISGTFDFFKLAGSERELVYGIIDKMTEFENANANKDTK